MMSRREVLLVVLFAFAAAAVIYALMFAINDLVEEFNMRKEPKKQTITVELEMYYPEKELRRPEDWHGEILIRGENYTGKHVYLPKWTGEEMVLWEYWCTSIFGVKVRAEVEP